MATAGLEVNNAQWAQVDYDHLKRVYVKTGRKSDMARALLAWKTLAEAQAMLQRLS